MRVAPWIVLLFALPALASECLVLERTCVEPGGTRTIDGVPVTRDCWRYEERRACLVEEEGVDGCESLEAAQTPGTCRKLESGCQTSVTDIEGVTVCLTESATYGCSERIVLPSVNAEWLGAEETTYVTEDDSACAALAADVACVRGADTDEDATGVTWNFRCEGTEVSGCTDLVKQGCTLTSEPSCDAALDSTCGLKSGVVTCVDIDASESIETGEATVTSEKTVALGGVIEDASVIAALENETTTCTVLSSTCVDTTPYWRTVNGRRSYSKCWGWKKQLSCTNTATSDTCARLSEVEDCAVESTRCVAKDEAGNCVTTEKIYACTKPHDSVDAGDAEVIDEDEVLEGVVEYSDCTDLEHKDGCVLIASECAEPAETRTLGGVEVTKDCWRQVDTYRCTQAGTGSGETVVTDDCAALEEEGCELVSTDCLGTDESGECTMLTKVYRCTGVGDSVDLGEDCGDTVCWNDTCEDKQSETGSEFFEGIALMEIAREAGVYGDVSTNSLFAGTASGCSVKAAGFSCCRSSNAQSGLSGGNRAFGMVLAETASAAWETVKYVGSPFVYDVLSASDATAPLLTMLYGNAGSGVYSPEFSFYGVTFTHSASGWSFGFSPASFMASVAVDLAMDYLSCSDEDKTHALRQSEGLCHYVGSYCKKKSGLGCLEKRESWVCFNSRLALLVQEAARKQLGLGWGTPESPMTRGLTLSEFQSIDFTQVDLAPFISEVARKLSTTGSAAYPSEAAQTRSVQRAQSVGASGRSSVIQYTAVDSLKERCVLAETGEPVNCQSIVIEEPLP